MLLFELIQIALGKRDKLSHNPTLEEWDGLYTETIKQSVVGVAFEGVKILPKEQWPPQTLLFEWIGICEQIKNQNRIADRRSAEVTRIFADAGFRNCILKGQGNARLYPNPLSRTPGDIDIWIEGKRDEINRFVTIRYPDAQDGEKHIEYPIYNDIPVEVHYTPSTLRIPKYNRKLQFFFAEYAMEQFNNWIELPEGGKICIPTMSFNIIYQMAHLMSHFFVEGIGLRHFVDYYYLLKALDGRFLSLDARKVFKELGMLKFAKGVMWIEKKCLKIEDRLLILELDEKVGKVIMTEMVQGGNFGYYDERYKARKKGYFVRGFTDIIRLVKLASVFPEDAIWKIWRKLINQKWKVKNKLIR